MFKVGDRVKLKPDETTVYTGLRHNHRYTVVVVKPVHIDVRDEFGAITGGWYSSRFVLANSVTYKNKDRRLDVHATKIPNRLHPNNSQE